MKQQTLAVKSYTHYWHSKDHILQSTSPLPRPHTHTQTH